jgi:hypothetical protein
VAGASQPFSGFYDCFTEERLSTEINLLRYLAMTDKLRSVADRLQLLQFEENMEYAMLVFEDV